jgi:hypothetical protein
MNEQELKNELDIKEVTNNLQIIKDRNLINKSNFEYGRN